MGSKISLDGELSRTSSIMGPLELLKEEFTWQNLLLEDRHPARFVQSECGCPRLYVLWRVVWMMYHIAAIITSGILEQFYATTPENRIKWLIFLTNWVFILLTVNTIVDFCCTVFVAWKHSEWLNVSVHVETLPWYLKTLWLLSNICNSTSLIVSIAYWASGTFDPKVGLSGHRVLPFLGHGMNSIYIACNLCVTAMPVRLLHCWMPVVFTIIYGTFNVLYVIMGQTDDADHPYIYPPIDWRGQPLKAEVLALGLLFGVVLIHTVVFLLHLVRRWLGRTCMCHVTGCKTPEQCSNPKGKTELLNYGSTSQ